jgi:outer membrane immunogenic protein
MRRFQGVLLGAIAVIGFASITHAADMAVKAPPPATAPVYSWTGFYVGGNAGYAWNDPSVTFVPIDTNTSALCTIFGSCPPPASFSIDGPLGGLQAGYNWQVDQKWLLGIETDFDWSHIRGTGTSNFLLGPTFFPPGNANFQASQNIDWFGTIRGRLGFLLTNNFLVYATGGFAYGRVKENVVLNNSNYASLYSGNGFSFTCVTGPNCFLGSSSRTATGGTVGAGLEYALSKNISVKAEYLYVNLGRGDHVNVVAQTVIGAYPVPSSYTANYSTLDFQVIRGGINYKF